MKLVAGALLITLANAGHWFGGKEGRITVDWAATGGPSSSVLAWELSVDGASLADGEVLLADAAPSTIVVNMPNVRARTVLRWTYVLRSREDGSLISKGERTIHVYPDDLFAGAHERWSAKTLVICDEIGKLGRLLTQADVPFKNVSDLSQVASATADVLVIGPGVVSDTVFAQRALVGHAESGASVMIFEQRNVPQLCGYQVQRRRLPTKLEWRNTHPLLAGFESDDLVKWWTAANGDAYALQLPADAAVLELATWPAESSGSEPVPIDALLAVEAVGRGRIVYCQLPLESWQDDPRTQLFARNCLDYLMTTRPAPTPPPSARAASQPIKPKEPPTIRIRPGVEP